MSQFCRRRLISAHGSANFNSLRGRRVRAHCAWRNLILECAEAGVDIIDHGDTMDDACIEAMVAHGTFLCPALYFVKLLIEYSGDVPIASSPGLRSAKA